MLQLRLSRRVSVSALVVIATAGLAVLIAGCSGSSNSSSATSAAAAASPTTAAATLDSYVANVCKATAAFETAARPTGATPAATPDGTQADPATRAAGLLTAANTYLSALQADGPPADLTDYNNQLVNEVQTAITDLGNGNFGGGGARGGAPANGTPFARPSRTPGANPNPSRTPFARPSGTPGAGFGGGRGPAGAAGGGAVRLFLRNLPTPPAADAAQMDQLAAANADCQSAGFSFAPN